jgi:DNA-binding transcriptional LysR family regulator
MSLVPSLIARFQKLKTVPQFVYKTGTSNEIEEMVLKRTIELALISNPMHSSLLVTEPYIDERLVLVVSKNHPHANQATLTAAELTTIPLIVSTRRDGVSGTLDILCRHLPPNTKPNVSMRVASPGALKSAVLAGAGIGVMYEDVAIAELRKGTLKKLDPVGMNLNGQIYLVYRRDLELSPVAVEFITFLREQRAPINNHAKNAFPGRTKHAIPKMRNLSVAVPSLKIFPLLIKSSHF